MAFRPKDQIDMMLVQKYATEKADNAQLNALVNPNEMMSAMKDFSSVQRNFFQLSSKLKTLCKDVNSKAAAYKASRLPSENYGYEDMDAEGAY